MKTKLTIISILAIMASACSTGTHLAKSYDDDIYFSPKDVPPVAVATEQSSANVRSNNNNTKDRKIVMSQIERDADGSATVNNYIYQQDKNAINSDVQSYDMNGQNLVDSDTTRYYNDDDVKTVINNYYDSDDVDYSYRIRRFHNPYYFGSFYDDWYYDGYYSPWYSGYYGLNWGWNYGWGYYDPWYSWSWGYPYHYGYYSPFAFGIGYYGWGGYYGGYYGGGYGNYGWGGGNYYKYHDVARRRDTNLSLPGGSGRNYNGSISGVNSGRRPNSVVGDNDLKNATIVNDRRASSSVTGRRLSNIPGREISAPTRQNSASGTIRRIYEPSTTGRTYDQNSSVRQNNYTPSYNRPRVVNQSNYNSNNYSRSRSSATYDRSAARSSSSGIQYTEPRSSSSMRQTYRSSSSYSNGSSSSGYSRPSGNYSNRSSNSNPSPSYSAPSRSSSSYSSGGGSSYSGGSSGGSSGGGGGSGHRR